MISITIITLAVIGWIVMLSVKRSADANRPPAPGVPVASTAAVPKAPPVPAPTPEIVAKSSAALYPKLTPDMKPATHRMKVLSDAANPVSAVTFYQYSHKAPGFADPTGARVDHFIGGEVLRRCELPGKVSAHFGWFEVRPGRANEPPPGRDVGPQRIHVALRVVGNGQVDVAYAPKRSDVEQQFDEGWGCAASVANAAPAAKSAPGRPQ